MSTKKRRNEGEDLLNEAMKYGSQSQSRSRQCKCKKKNLESISNDETKINCAVNASTNGINILNDSMCSNSDSEEYDLESDINAEEYLPSRGKVRKGKSEYLGAAMGHNGNHNSPCEIIKAILEVAVLSKLESGENNRSKTFWKSAIESEKNKSIFKGYKSETLRKYWAQLRDIGNMEKIKELIDNEKIDLDSQNIKYL
jgi:hypothetical protein